MGLSSFANGMVVIGKLFENKFFDGILLYNLMVYSMMIAIYHIIDFNKHFSMNRQAGTGTKMYFTWMTHANVMAGEITPKTSLGRGLMCMHVFLTWGMLMVLLAPSVLTLSRLVKMKSASIFD
jgi:hypothetical protein